LPVYGVKMGQAISMAALGDNKLKTGSWGDDRLISCSAIILVNPGKRSAGLYHFPAGDIYSDLQSWGLLQEMDDDLAPTEVWVVFGSQPFPHLPPTENPVNEKQHHNLCTWLQGNVQRNLKTLPAKHGSAAVSIVNGEARVDANNTEAVTDLSNYGHANYAAEGFKIYLKSMY
jgi:hypothetical protein